MKSIINNFTMKKVNKVCQVYLIIAIFFIAIPLSVNAQRDTDLHTVSANITDLTGKKIEHVAVFATGSLNRIVTDKEGFFELKTLEEDFIIITRTGYEKSVVVVEEGKIADETIIMNQWDVMNPGEKIQVAHGLLAFQRLTGSIERITGEELRDYPTVFLRESLAGRLSGLSSFYNATSPEIESFGNAIRGSGFGEVYVDGIPSNLDQVITPREVYDVIVAKDYGSSFLYGGTAATGA